LDRQQIAELADEPEDERNLLKIAAPLDGTIVRRNAVGGESVESTTELFSVARLDHVWAHLDVFERDLERIRVGQEVVFRVAGLAPRQFMGKVIWVDSEVHERTRTIRVRAQLENADTLLRAHMFGQGEIRVRSPRQSLIVPRDAVQWEGTSFVVFVRGKRLSEFEPRRVLIGRNDGHYAELAWAELELGDNVATTGSFLLKTELMRDAIGAGCCGED
jgi:cobalt-zinc-cadmium efflux system membrane fusion protein